MRRTPSPSWCAYFAGFLDGEGCFMLNGSPRIAVSNTYFRVLRMLRSTFGGRIRTMSSKNPNARPCFQWYVSGRDAQWVLTCVYPYLVEKRAQAELLARWADYPPRSALRAALKTSLKTLKRIPYVQDDPSG